MSLTTVSRCMILAVLQLAYCKYGHCHSQDDKPFRGANLKQKGPAARSVAQWRPPLCLCEHGQSVYTRGRSFAQLDMISLLYNTPHEIIQHHDVTAKKYLRMEVYATDASSMIHFSRRFVLVENRVGACRMWHSVRTQFFYAYSATSSADRDIWAGCAYRFRHCSSYLSW